MGGMGTITQQINVITCELRVDIWNKAVDKIERKIKSVKRCRRVNKGKFDSGIQVINKLGRHSCHRRRVFAFRKITFLAPISSWFLNHPY